MATIKELLQNFCYRKNLPTPSSFVGVTSPAERQYLSLFQKIGDDLRNRPFNWPQLKRGYTFTTTTGQRDIQLPGDFYRLLESSQWDTTNNWPMRGPISDYNYTMRQFSVVSLQTRKAFRLIGPVGYLYSTSPYNKRSAGYFEIDPAGLNDTDQLFFGYVSCNWIWPRNWVASTGYTAGDLRSGVGNIYRASTTATSGATRPSWTSGSSSDGGVTWAVYNEPFLCTPENAALNDADFCLFDDDLMIEGMVWAYEQAKGLDGWQSKRGDWEQAVKGAAGRFNGPVRINMSDEMGNPYDTWPNVPNGSWSV